MARRAAADWGPERSQPFSEPPPSPGPVRAGRRPRKVRHPAVTRLGAPKMPSSAARAHSDLSSALLAVALGLSKRRLRVEAERPRAAGDDRAVGDRPAFTELGNEHFSGEFGARPGLERERHARRRAGSFCGKGSGRWKGQARRGADALEVAPHVAALGGIDVERRVAPALGGENRAEQKRPPSEVDAARLRRAPPTRIAAG